MIKSVGSAKPQKNSMSSEDYFKMSGRQMNPSIDYDKKAEIPNGEFVVGYWEHDNYRLPYQPALDLVVPGWNETEEATACVEYMKNGYAEEQWMGWADCRICGDMLGVADNKTPDGKWLYPQQWEHYIAEHSVKPDNEEFIQDAVNWYRSRSS